MDTDTTIIVGCFAALLVAWAVDLGRRVRELEEDVDLLADDDKALVQAKRKLAGRRVSRETERTRL